MEIHAASVTAFYLYDVAEQIDLVRLRSTLGTGAAARLQPATTAPSYLQYQRWNNLFGRGYINAAQQLHALFIDVNELTDRTENALKIVGDIYAARVFNLAAARLGVARWKQSVEDKLETLDDIYRFAVEQVSISRGQFLELTVILILVLELVLFFLGIMK